MTSFWYKAVAGLICGAYFGRLRILHPEHLPSAGPVLYLGLHRNGAVDGFVYSTVLPRATFLISTQLRRSAFGRLFFSGIEVARAKDGGDPRGTAEGLARCADHLRSGGELCIFPEGTSALGPRHLPFKSGAARVLLDALASGGSVPVIPLGITYDSPWSFRSGVEIVVGPPIPLEFPEGTSPKERLPLLRARIESALEQVGVNVDSDAIFLAIQRIAGAATAGTSRSYHGALKALEKGVPAPVGAAWRELEAEAGRGFCLRYHGTPLALRAPVPLAILGLALWGPIVAAAAVANAPPLLAGATAGRVLPDAPNVISLWRILVGMPLFALWAASVLIALSVLAPPLAPWTYVLVTLAGLEAYDRTKRLACGTANALLRPGLTRRLEALRDAFRECVPDGPA